MNALTPNHYHFIILPAHYQLAYLKNRQPGLHGPERLYTKEALLRGLFFDYDEETLIAVMRRQNCSLSWARTLIQEMYLLPDAPMGSPRVKALIDLYQEMQRLGCLRINPSFAHNFTGKSALVIGYHPQDPELAAISQRLGLSLHWKEPCLPQPRTVTQCATLREEVHHVYNQISRLIDEGTPLDRISILCPDPNYDFELRLASRYFQLPINFISKQSYADTTIGKRTYELYKAEGASRDITDDIVTEFSLDDQHPVLPALKEIDDIEGHHSERVQFLKERLAATLIDPVRYQPAITEIETPYPIEGQHIFVLGAKQGFVPRVYKPHGYLSDAERAMIGRLTSDLENENEAGQWRHFFEAQTNLYLSFSADGAAENYPSPLFKEMGYAILKYDYDPIEYGGARARFRLAALLDHKRVYHLDSDLISPYKEHYDLSYRDYDYRYRPFDAGLGRGPMTLAYTGVKTFYQCRFRYYLDYILRLDAREDTFFIRLGNLAHDLLEAMYQPGFDFDEVFTKFKKEYPFTPKETALIDGMKQDLRTVVEFNAEHQRHMTEPIIATEVKAQFALDDQTVFKGKLDKIVVLQSENRRYVAIIDYKTGSEVFEPQKLAHGSSMQLPTYALLLSHTPGYEDSVLIGFYIQSIIPSSRLYGDTDLKLKGRSLADPVALAAFDDTVARSEFIKGLALKASDGSFYKKAPVADAEQFETYKKMTLELIENANRAIRASDFTIDPKQLGTEEHSCQYCQFRDVCFRPDEAVTKISLKTEESQYGAEVE
jgi:hypothetical protein